MNSYRPNIQEIEVGNDAVSDALFGVNVVTIYDEELSSNDSEILKTLNKSGASHLRFPGGSATEHYFDMADPEASVSNYDTSQTLLPLSGFLDAAASIKADVALVIPTKRAFAETATSSISSGTFGSRRDLSEDYILELKNYLRYSLDAAQMRNVEITAVEIGNEFWGSGEMTATEYGHVVGQLLPILNDFFESYGAPDTKLLIQTTHAASQIFSPKDDVEVHVSFHQGEETVLALSEIKNLDLSGSSQTGGTYTIQGQGSAVEQNQALAATINSYGTSAQLVDGILDHFYPTKGFSEIDQGYEFFFNQFEALADQLDLAESDRKNPDGTYALEFHVTEWNTRSQEWALDNRGLHQSAMLVEILYEFATHGVDSANAWPLTFDQSQSVTLVNNDQNGLTIAGETFRLMSEFIPGTTPLFDWSLEGDLDIHGFVSSQELVLVISERSGQGDRPVILNLNDFIESEKFTARIVKLWDGTGEGNNSRAEPTITEFQVGVTGGELEVDIQPWEIAFIEILENDVSISQPIFNGTSGNDEISGAVTDDTIIAAEGNDTITGEDGNDLLLAGHGRDSLHGGNGEDYLKGNAGNDTLRGNSGSDTLDGGLGHDLLAGGADNDSLRGGHGVDTLRGGSGSDHLRGNSGNDSLDGGLGNDFLYGGLGADELSGNFGNDRLAGFVGNDLLTGGANNDILRGGSGIDTLRGGSGSDHLQGNGGNDSLDGGLGNDFLYGGFGYDTLTGGGGADTFIFSDIAGNDTITDFQIGIDHIRIKDGADNLGDLSILSQGGHGTITFGKAVIVVEGVTADALFVSDNFLF
ncbi:hypothetical protein KMP13_15020 [Epibacterium ulvae]|uniref:calcium-binding protein n=1 Tax=Epibacterium ulvae TaxID=1156985 RepID=UPI001BFC9E8F|nr:calcium-binding protein [Epibacterium ulvae]MBT8155158.1 hypothetical protein [Epibacterium ulvae]